MAGLPNITGDISTAHGVCHYDGFNTGTNSALVASNATGVLPDGIQNAKGLKTLSFNASRSNPIYGKSSTVTPLSLSAKIVLKY